MWETSSSPRASLTKRTCACGRGNLVYLIRWKKSFPNIRLFEEAKKRIYRRGGFRVASKETGAGRARRPKKGVIETRGQSELAPDH